jgi:pyruvate ferredoxin oxidoreductase alpha subunit
MSQLLEGSHAIALTIKNIEPAVIAAYPITPQTHIVEDLAKYKADGVAEYEYSRAESEFAAASIVLGASATGVRTYTATSSQGLLLMAEVIYNIAGMRLPVVMTCANRAISAPINIWNDHQDAMAVRDAGWIMLFAENSQEAVEQHILAYKIAEKLSLPVMVNVDGFLLTHTYSPVEVPTREQIKKFLPDYKPKKGAYLDPANPITMGALATPTHYMEIREELQRDLLLSKSVIEKEYFNYYEKIKTRKQESQKTSDGNNAFFEYYGPSNPKTVIVAMSSIVGTIKEAVDEYNQLPILKRAAGKVGVLKLKLYRPFPADEIIKALKPAKNIIVLDRAISLGNIGPVALDIKSAAYGKLKANISNFVVGLGGRDVTKDIIKKIIGLGKNKAGDEAVFVGK